MVDDAWSIMGADLPTIAGIYRRHCLEKVIKSQLASHSSRSYHQKGAGA